MLLPPPQAQSHEVDREARVAKRGRPLRTVAEQIADHLATAIVNGEFRSGERVREVEVASLYGASRAPVREAIRDLAQRGLVRFQPRRGAFVVNLSLDTLADVFNIRAALTGLAAHMVATGGGSEFKIELRRRIDALASLVEEDDPIRFAAASARVGTAVARGCASESLVAILDQQVRHSIWGLLWRERPLDFHTDVRRREAVAQWMAVLEAIEAGDGPAAERRQRRIHLTSRDRALESVRNWRPGEISPDRRIDA